MQHISVRCSLTSATNKCRQAKDRATKVSSISCVTFWFGISRILFISSYFVLYFSPFFFLVDVTPPSISNCARNMMQCNSNRKIEKSYKMTNKKNEKKLHVDCMTFAMTYTAVITLQYFGIMTFASIRCYCPSFAMNLICIRCRFNGIPLPFISLHRPPISTFTLSIYARTNDKNRSRYAKWSKGKSTSMDEESEEWITCNSCKP